MSSLTDEIKARIDLVDLIGRSVPLKRAGSHSYKGLCPFHQEKTPSFHVWADSGTWRCFGCSKSGTAFDWLMEREHVEFGEALRVLAQMANVQLPTHRAPEDEENERRLYDLLGKAQAYYVGALKGTAGEVARRYLEKRGVTDQAGEEFGLGYAPSANGLLRYLREGGFNDKEVQASGIVSTADDGRLFDLFRERVMFPIRDGRGRTVAFGGRALEEGQPKYVNSRETLLFHKQETLFALDLARRAIGQEGRAVLVEGYMDALTAHQHGYRNVVATLGTAVTERQLQILSRLGSEIVLALDSDAAGQQATWRTLQVAEQSLRRGVAPVVGPHQARRQYAPQRLVTLKVLALPGAKDPDELIRTDAGAWVALVAQAQPVVEFVLKGLATRHDLSSATGKAEAVTEACEVLVGLANPIEQAHYVQEVADLLRVEEHAVWRVLRDQQHGMRRPKRGPSPSEVGTEAEKAPPPLAALNALDAYTLALVLRDPSKRPTLSSGHDEPELQGIEARALWRALAGATPDDEGHLVLPNDLQPYLAQVERYLPVVRDLAVEDFARDVEETRLRLQKRAAVERQRQVRDLLRDATEDQERQSWVQEMVAIVHGIQEIDRELVGKDLGSAGRPLKS